jgi:D-arginine dehydrogenase
VEEFDALIVGSGIAGAATAAFLARGTRTILVETEPQPGFHATGRSAALYVPNYGAPAIRALTRASKAFFSAPPTGFGVLLGRRRGVLYVDFEQHSTAIEALLDSSATPGAIERCSVEDATRKVPILRSPINAAFEDDAYDLEVAAIHQGFLRQARANGAALQLNARLISLERDGAGWRVELEQGKAVRAAQVVNAAGAWADDIAVRAGLPPMGLTPLLRTAAIIRPSVLVDDAWPEVIDTDGALYFKPDAARILISPADETPTPPSDAQPDDWMVATAVDRFERRTCVTVQRVEAQWAGLRTFSADRVPVAGRDPVEATFIWCAGQGGYGIQTSPALGRLTAAILESKPIPDDILAIGLGASALSPARFSRMNSSGQGKQ